MKNVLIRNETEQDYGVVERIAREAFWNLYVPGCEEHYLTHIMRGHEDFIPELDFVVELDGQVIGNVMYTKARLSDECGEEKPILTFGPVCILPEYQRRGYSKILLEHSFEKAMELGYEVIVIFGDPNNYVSRGFKSCKKQNVCLEKDVYPCAMLVKELVPGALGGRKWYYYESSVLTYDSAGPLEFDKRFEAKEKKEEPCQEIFYIFSNSVIPAVQVNFYDSVEDNKLKFAVIIAKTDGKWVFCRHRKRSTYEVPGGHREAGETILEAAKRELYEETGALEFTIKPVCVYAVKAKKNDGLEDETFGMLFYAEIQTFENELHSEIEEIIITDKLPKEWTYPLIQPVLLEHFEKGCVSTLAK